MVLQQYQTAFRRWRAGFSERGLSGELTSSGHKDQAVLLQNLEVVAASPCWSQPVRSDD